MPRGLKFLDDVYVVTTPARTREALDVVTSSIETRAGVAANLGKTRVYNCDGGPAPPGIAELGANVALVPRYEVRPCMLALYFLGETSKVFRLVKTSKVFARKHRRCFR